MRKKNIKIVAPNVGRLCIDMDVYLHGREKCTHIGMDGI